MISVMRKADVPAPSLQPYLWWCRSFDWLGLGHFSPSIRLPKNQTVMLTNKAAKDEVPHF